MKNFLKSIFGLLLFLMISSSGYSKEDPKPLFWLGAYGDYQRNLHIVDFNQLPGVPSCCPKYTNGSGNGYSFGALFEVEVKKNFFLNVRFGFSSFDGLLEEEETAANVLVVEDGKEKIMDLLVNHSLDANLHGLGLEPTINFRFYEGLNAVFGLNVSYLFTQQVDQMEKILQPDNITFLDGTLIRNQQEALEIPNKKPLQLFGVLGLSYNLPIGRETYLAPEVKALIPISAISDVSWKVTSLQLGLSAKIPFYPSVPTPEYRDTVYQCDTSVIAVAGLKDEVLKISKRYKPENYKISKKDSIIFKTVIKETYEKQIPKSLSFTSALTVTGITRDNQRQDNPAIVIEEIETTESFPLLPYVFFLPENSLLKETNLRLLNPGQTNEFSEKNLKWNTLEIYDEMLNIVGARMLDNPGAILNVTGCNSGIGLEKNNMKLSGDRADAVKNYLVTSWNVNPDNIKTKKQNLPDFPGKVDVPDGQAENQRAELSSSNSEILKPVTLKEVQLIANPPKIELYPKVVAEGGVKSWDITISQDGKVIRNYNGSSNPPEKLTWVLEEQPIPRLESPIQIALTSFDEIDQKSVSNVDLKIQQLTIRKKRKEIKNDTTIERYSLILFDFDKADITEHQKYLLKDIKERIKPVSKVTISGYADRTGDTDYNRDLAYRRTVEIQKILQVQPDKLLLNPVGSDILLYNNDLPQGRSYCRTVQITIETPIKE